MCKQLPYIFRAPISLGNLFIASTLLSCAQTQPPPPYPWATGQAVATPIDPNVVNNKSPVTKSASSPAEAELVAIKPNLNFRIAAPTATANVLLNSPSGQSDDRFAAAVALTLNTLVVGAPSSKGGGAAWVFDLNNLNSKPIKLFPPQMSEGDSLGAAVAISASGRFIAVGAPYTNVDGKQNVGVVHVWENISNTWGYVGFFAHSEIEAESQLGSCVAISDDTLIAGAPQASVDISQMPPYNQDKLNEQAEWLRQERKLLMEQPTAIASQESYVQQNGQPWTNDMDEDERGDKLVENARAMSRVNYQKNQNALALRSQTEVEHGKIATWMRNPMVNQWSESILIFPDQSAPNIQFGGSLYLKEPWLIVGASKARAEDRIETGVAYIFRRSVSGWLWQPVAKMVENASATEQKAIHQNEALNNSELFMLGPLDRFGWAVCIQGNSAIVGAPQSNHGSLSDNGSAFIYERGEEPLFLWTQKYHIHAPDFESLEAFGSAVGIAGVEYVVGTPLKKVRDQTQAGAVYVFREVPDPTESFMTKAECSIKLISATPQTNGRFGAMLACTQNLIVVAEPGASDRLTSGTIHIFKRTLDSANAAQDSWGVSTLSTAGSTSVETLVPPIDPQAPLQPPSQ